LTTADQAGLFAFGANLIWIGVGVISAGAQVYYPRHLMLRDQRKLLNQMLVLLALASVGIMVAIVLCRFELSTVFPKFAAADRSTAMILVSAIPICLAAWVLPIVIATAERPWVEAVIVFGGSILVLLGCMWVGDDLGGIVGQAVGCTLSAGTLLAAMLFLLHKHKMLHMRGASVLLGLATLAMAVCCAEWHYLFGGGVL
jgi:O-antigen/teichoic acid export membrane protein